MEYRHYSFDLWGTLIRANERFKKKRLEYFHSYFLRRGCLVPTDEIEAIIVNVWKYFDALSQMNGKSPDALEMYAMVIFRATGNLKGITPLEMAVIYNDIEKIFLENPPTLWDEDTKPVLKELALRGKTMSLLSNTSYTKGSTLSIVLGRMGILQKFLFTLFSDEHNLSKPNREFFRMVDKLLPYDVEDIIHVGDNELCDGIGAQEYGFGHLIINQPQSRPLYTIKDLL